MLMVFSNIIMLRTLFCKHNIILRGGIKMIFNTKNSGTPCLSYKGMILAVHRMKLGLRPKKNKSVCHCCYGTIKISRPDQAESS